jgi:3-oxoacyl-[acyl-carrier-protein] synthase III
MRRSSSPRRKCVPAPPARRRGNEDLLAEAADAALAAANLTYRDIDGLTVASFSFAPDHAVDIGWKLRLRLRWLMDEHNGGASALSALAHALQAVESGTANAVLLLAGERLERDDFRALTGQLQLCG